MARESVDEAAEAAGAEEATEEAAAAPSKKDPKPEGWVSPVELAVLYGKARGSFCRPQIIYGYIRNNKAFGENTDIVRRNTDNHFMVNVEAGLAYLAERDATRAQATADREAAAAAEAAGASEAEAESE